MEHPEQVTDKELRAREEAEAQLQAQQTANEQRLRDDLEQSITIAQGVRAPTKVPAKRFTQCGQPALVARCPHCHTVAGLSGEGRHLCRGCYRWLEYVDEG